ncbi:unnamed protein product, partial [Vitis vinifera]
MLLPLLAAGAGITLVDSHIAASKSSQDPPMGFALIRSSGHDTSKCPMDFRVLEMWPLQLVMPSVYMN